MSAARNADGGKYKKKVLPVCMHVCVYDFHNWRKNEQGNERRRDDNIILLYSFILYYLCENAPSSLFSIRI